MASPRDETRGLTLVALSTMAYGILPILGKVAYAAGVRPLPLLAWRYVIAALLIALLDRGPRLPLRQQKPTLWTYFPSATRKPSARSLSSNFARASSAVRPS